MATCSNIVYIILTNSQFISHNQLKWKTRLPVLIYSSHLKLVLLWRCHTANVFTYYFIRKVKTMVDSMQNCFIALAYVIEKHFIKLILAEDYWILLTWLNHMNQPLDYNKLCQLLKKTYLLSRLLKNNLTEHISLAFVFGHIRVL